MKTGTAAILKEVKENQEDHEWYPSTREIIEALYRDIKELFRYEGFSMLDIGGGNAKVFKVIDELSGDTEEGRSSLPRISKRYVIEKSRTLINHMDSNVFVIGTDFWQQTLIDKRVDVIYSNPPYREYELWAEKVIREANASVVYLCIPERWTKSRLIDNAIKQRDAEVVEIGKFSFIDAEDRAARANVSLIKIQLTYNVKYNKNQKQDPFKLWFDQTFKIDLGATSKKSEYEVNKTKSERIKELVKGQNLIERLEELYTKEMSHLMQNYRAVSELDMSLLKELGISTEGMMEGLKKKIEGLKNLYWKELFDNLNTITDRLTERSRNSLLETLTSHTTVDFTSDNSYGIVIWAIKNANQYYEKQMLDLYYKFSSSENIRLYKSNHRMVRDGWRYSREEMSHYLLDYRIVHNFYGALDSSSYRGVRGLGENAAQLLGDVIAVAGNLGFNTADRPGDFDWYAGCKNTFLLGNKNPLMEVKAFKNGNMHFKFSPEFMKALNIEAARLNKWIKSPQEATEEFDISEEDAMKYFGTQFVLGRESAGQLLLGCAA